MLLTGDTNIPSENFIFKERHVLRSEFLKIDEYYWRTSQGFFQIKNWNKIFENSR